MSGHRARAVIGMDLSRQSFADMGARFAMCFMFSTCANTRAFLKAYRLGDAALHVLVVDFFRDSGSHLNLTGNANGANLNKKVLRGLLQLFVAWLSHPSLLLTKNLSFAARFFLRHCMDAKPLIFHRWLFKAFGVLLL